MGIAKKTDGRYLVGIGVDSVNDYKGSAAYRDIYIQLTSSGATAKSEEYLTFLKDYGFHANASGEPIMPPSVNVWISNNGVTTAVEADDVSIDGNNYTICGIKWDGSAWDYTNAGQGSGGGGSSLPSYTSEDIGKVLTIGEGSEPKWDNVPNKVVKTDIPQEMTTFIMSNLQRNIPAAIAAGIGVPTVVVASETVTDTDGVSALLEDIATAANNNAIIMLGRLTVLDYAPVVTPGADIASLTFTYPIYYASNYAFHIDIVAQCDLTTYNLNAVITLLKSLN